MADFDPYLQWLGIRSPERPPNHYRLLGVEPFESDASVIETAADRQMAHVRTFQHGKDADLSQQILNELATAKVCLLDGKSKFEYDTALKQKYFNDPPPVDPTTIDIKPTSSRVSVQDADQPDIEIETEEDLFQLSRPKRGSRSVLPRVLIGTTICLVVILGVIYQFGPVSEWFSPDSIVKDPPAKDTPATVPSSSGKSVDDPAAPPVPDESNGQTPTDDVEASSECG